MRFKTLLPSGYHPTPHFFFFNRWRRFREAKWHILSFLSWVIFKMVNNFCLPNSQDCYELTKKIDEKSDSESETPQRTQHGQTHLELAQNILLWCCGLQVRVSSDCSRRLIMRMITANFYCLALWKVPSICYFMFSLQQPDGAGIVSLSLQRRKSVLSDIDKPAHRGSFLVAEPDFKTRFYHSTAPAFGSS